MNNYGLQYHDCFVAQLLAMTDQTNDKISDEDRCRLLFPVVGEDHDFFKVQVDCIAPGVPVELEVFHFPGKRHEDAVTLPVPPGGVILADGVFQRLGIQLPVDVEPPVRLEHAHHVPVVIPLRRDQSEIVLRDDFPAEKPQEEFAEFSFVIMTASEITVMP